MLPKDLKFLLLQKLKCEIKGREFRTICKLCGNKSFYLNPGQKKPVVARCRHCPVERKHEVFQAMGLRYEDLGQEMPPHKINELWDLAFPEMQVNVDDGNRLPISSVEVRHAVYSYILNDKACVLSPEAEDWLQKRGLTKQDAKHLGYRSTPDVLHAARIVDELHPTYGDTLLGVPGFVKVEGKYHLRIAEKGIFTPCRDKDGMIACLKIRRKQEGKSGKMFTLSSSSGNGPKGEFITHWPLGVGQVDLSQQPLFITEGERKADVFWVKTRQPILGIPGVGAIARLVAVLDTLNVQHVVAAFDYDKAGHRATIQLAYELSDKPHIQLSLAQWDTKDAAPSNT